MSALPTSAGSKHLPHATLVAGMIAALASLLSLQPALAGDFRMETKVFLADQDEPAMESVTIFYNGLVYDWVRTTDQVAIFDLRKERFILLDIQREIRTDISMHVIDDFAYRMRNELSERSEELAKFLANPEFNKVVDSVDPDKITFGSDWMVYEMETIRPPNLETAQQFAVFSQWYTRLNTLTNPNLLGRMVINDQLAADGRIPVQVQFTPYRKSLFNLFNRSKTTPDKEHQLRAEHNFGWLISRTDKDRIDSINRFLVSFKPVEYGQFRDGAATKE